MMFIIASTGRCGTEALVHALDKGTKHQVYHEPEPTLLEEGWLKHHSREYRHKPKYLGKMLGLAKYRFGGSYGEAIRAPNLLPDMRCVAPRAKVLVIIRDPLQYIISAHYKGVLSKGNRWDAYRLMPKAIDDTVPLAERIAHHWCVVNNYLLDFAERDSHTTVVLHQPRIPQVVR